MPLKTLKYFSTLFVLALALVAGWWLWNFYMQSPWTRDGKIRAEQVSITPQVSGSITALLVKDNQFVSFWLRITSLLKREMFYSALTTPLTISRS